MYIKYDIIFPNKFELMKTLVKKNCIQTLLIYIVTLVYTYYTKYQ